MVKHTRRGSYAVVTHHKLNSTAKIKKWHVPQIKTVYLIRLKYQSKSQDEIIENKIWIKIDQFKNLRGLIESPTHHFVQSDQKSDNYSFTSQ